MGGVRTVVRVELWRDLGGVEDGLGVGEKWSNGRLTQTWRTWLTTGGKTDIVARMFVGIN